MNDLRSWLSEFSPAEVLKSATRSLEKMQIFFPVGGAGTRKKQREARV